MGEEVDIMMAQVVRASNEQAWGFRMEGGHDTQVPLRIALVASNSPSALIGLQAGDVITKIFNRQTKFLSHKQATDIISAVTGKELTLTVERTVPYTKSQPNHQLSFEITSHQTPFSQQPTQQPSLHQSPIHPSPIPLPLFHQSPTNLSQTPEQVRNKREEASQGSYQFDHTPLQPSHQGPRHGHDSQDLYHLPQSYRQTASIQLAQNKTPPQASPQLHQQPNQQSYQQPHQNPVRQQHTQQFHQQPHQPKTHYKSEQATQARYKKYMEEDDEEVDGKSPPPQSQTFRRLQNYMENNVPPSGPQGLPPPRSATNETDGRMKVIMPQQYNNPMSMYSTHNVLDTFSSQVGSMLSPE